MTYSQLHEVILWSCNLVQCGSTSLITEGIYFLKYCVLPLRENIMWNSCGIEELIMLHLKRLQPNQLSLHRREKSRASGTRMETRLPRSSRLYSLARSLAARFVRYSKWPAGEICFASFEVITWLECHKGKCSSFFPLQRGVMSFCFKVVSFSFLEVFNERARVSTKYETPGQWIPRGFISVHTRPSLKRK